MALPDASGDDRFLPALTQGELAEISTRKMRAALPPEARHWSRQELAEMATKKTSAILPFVTDRQESVPPVLARPAHPVRAMGRRWFAALKKVFPIYAATHLAMLAISSLAFLYVTPDFTWRVKPISTLWNQWNHWDTGIYITIALHGYAVKQNMAFYPLYPLLVRAVMFAIGDPLISGLLISNTAALVMFTTLYRLVERDFGVERAFHTVLYLAIFPTAFFFSIMYTEATFLCFSTLTFYQLRNQRWGSAALFGFLACLTRPDGMFLAIPFCYEYLSRKWPREATSLRAFLRPGQILALLKSIRFNILFCVCIPAGIFCVMAYGHDRFGDWLAFVHAHDAWKRVIAFPGYGIVKALEVMYTDRLMNFTTMHMSIDVGADLLIGALLLLSFIGKWRLPPRFWSYGLYGLAIFLYLQVFIKTGGYPLESMSRFLLEIFPAFLILSQFRKNRLFHLCYLMLSLALFFFLASQFATGHWVL